MSPRRRRRHYQLHLPELPAEVYDEIIGFLWNDIPSLKACTLASRVLTFPSQKRLFHSIALRAPLQKLRNDHEIFTNGICGTSYNFWRLLVRSPHIARYVVSLHVVDERIHYNGPSDLLVTGLAPGRRSASDLASECSILLTESAADEAIDDGSQYVGYQLEDGQDVDLDEPLITVDRRHRDRSVPHRWLLKDKYFPLCAPLLHNLRSLAIFYDLRWSFLSGRVLATLLNLMQLQSLRYLEIKGRFRPDIMINQAIGTNVKHLFLSGLPEKIGRLRFPHPPIAPAYLDSLSIDNQGFLHDLQDCRVQLSRLRKLVVAGANFRHHVAVWSLLQNCSATLQDFEMTPSHIFKQDVLTTSHEEGPEDPIDLSKLTSLRRFAVRIQVASSGVTRTHFAWLGKILRSGFSTSVTQQLEELSIRVLYGDDCNRVVIDVLHWKDTFDALLEDGFRNLRTLKILVDAYSQPEVDEAVGRLNHSPGIAWIRSRRNLLVEIRPYIEVFEFAQDVRWETYEWDRWLWEHIA